MSSLVYVANSGKKGLDSAKRRDLAAMAGVGFIKLRHKELCRSPRETMGFQSVTIKSYDRAGGRQIIAVWSRDEEGKDVDRGALRFDPDEFYVGWAYVPDSPFNRNKLAAGLYNSPWEIADPRVRAEINPLAEMKRKEQEAMDRSRKAVEVAKEAAADDATRLKELEEENRKLRERLEYGSVATPDKLLKVSDETKVQAKLDDRLNLSDMNDRDLFMRFRDVAKSLVYTENADLIKSIKDTFKAEKGVEKGWATSTTYQRDVAPLVEAKALEMIRLDHPEVYNRITDGNNGSTRSDD